MEVEVIIQNRLGLHARPATKFVQLASTYVSEVMISDGETSANGKSILAVMMLAASQGTRLVLSAEGSDAEKAVLALRELVVSGFGERE